jgi:NTP pyrophosphatase (non-canonical NTP hydrolase)
MDITIYSIMSEIERWTQVKGWRPSDRTIGDELMLIVSELAEVLEAYREFGMNDLLRFGDKENFSLLPQNDPNAIVWINAEVIPKPEGVASEIADTLIRIFDFCNAYGIDPVIEIERKMKYNWTRDWRHGNKRL